MPSSPSRGGSSNNAYSTSCDMLVSHFASTCGNLQIPIAGESIAPWIKMSFVKQNGQNLDPVITVGNESAPGMPAKHMAAIKSMEYGHTDGYKINLETVIDKNSWKEADSWRLKQLSNWPIYQIKTMSVDYKDKQLVVNRDEEEWSNLKPVVDKLAFLPVVKLWSDIAPDENDIIYNFQLTMENDEIKTLTVGKRKISYRETKYWASRDGLYFYEIEEKDGVVLTDKFN